MTGRVIYRFAREILREPLILARVSLRQEYHYTRQLLRQRLRRCGRMATVREVLSRHVENAETRDKGIFF